MANLSVEDRLKEITEVCEMQRNKLKLCRLTMREHGIGHLYPGATAEYEENMKNSMALMTNGDTQQLYTAAKLHQFKFESASKKIKKLLNFIESKGISPQELQDYMIENTKILAEEDEPVFQIAPLKMEGEPFFDNAIEQEEFYKRNNPQTESLSDDSKERR